MMRAKTFGFSVAVVAVGFLVLTHPAVVGFTVMVLGALALWRWSRRWGVRR